MKTILRILLIILLSTSLSFGQNVVLTANSKDDLVDYYSISINGKEEYVKPIDFSESLSYSLNSLPDGDSIMTITAVSYMEGKSPPKMVVITKKTSKKWIMYKLDSTDGKQELKVKRNSYEIELIRSLQQGDFDGDGDTDGEDLAYFMKFYGKTK